MAHVYQISDGKLALELRPDGKGWYAVTCPHDPQLMTQARSVEEAFEMAHDAQKSLVEARAKLMRRLALAGSTGLSDSKAGLDRMPRRPKGANATFLGGRKTQRKSSKASESAKKS